MTGKEMLEDLGFRLEKTRGSYELWSQGTYRPNTEITFNVAGGRQVAKVQRHADKLLPVNGTTKVYEAMIARMRERDEA